MDLTIKSTKVASNAQATIVKQETISEFPVLNLALFKQSTTRASTNTASSSSSTIASNHGNNSNNNNNKWTDEERTVLIDMVKELPCLWDGNCGNYRDKDRRTVCWLDIGAKINKSASECQRCWNVMRNTWMRENRKMTKELQNGRKHGKHGTSGTRHHRGWWRFFEPMKFLRAVVGQPRHVRNHPPSTVNSSRTTLSDYLNNKESNDETFSFATSSHQDLMLDLRPYKEENNTVPNDDVSDSNEEENNNQYIDLRAESAVMNKGGYHNGSSSQNGELGGLSYPDCEMIDLRTGSMTNNETISVNTKLEENTDCGVENVALFEQQKNDSQTLSDSIIENLGDKQKIDTPLLSPTQSSVLQDALKAAFMGKFISQSLQNQQHTSIIGSSPLNIDNVSQIENISSTSNLLKARTTIEDDNKDSIGAASFTNKLLSASKILAKSSNHISLTNQLKSCDSDWLFAAHVASSLKSISDQYSHELAKCKIQQILFECKFMTDSANCITKDNNGALNLTSTKNSTTPPRINSITTIESNDSVVCSTSDSPI